MTEFVLSHFDVKLNLLFEEYIFRTKTLIPANQNDFIKNFVVVVRLL